MPRDPRALLIEGLFELERLSNALVDDSDSLLRAAFEEFLGELVRFDPTAVGLRFRAGRVDKLIARAQEILGPAYDEWVKEQRTEIARVGAHQAERATLHLKAVLGAGNAGRVASSTGLGANYFKRILDSQPFEGATLKEWAAEQKRKTVFRVGQQIKLGVANGETLGDIVRRVRGRATGTRGVYTGGVLQATTREAEAIVRTAVADVASYARHGVYEGNEDILEGYTLVVTLDGRTSPTCIKYGLTPTKVYPIEGGPRPPFHWRCRTTTAPAVDWRSLGIEPPEDGTRASATGQVAADTDFAAWLKGDGRAFADELLGKQRAKLFREGRMSLPELLKTDGGRVRLRPVEELAA